MSSSRLRGSEQSSYSGLEASRVGFWKLGLRLSWVEAEGRRGLRDASCSEGWKLRFEMQRFFLEVQGPKQKHGKRLRSEELAKLVERLAVVADWFWQACEGITGDPSALGHLDTFAGMLLCFNAAPLQD